MNPSKIVFSTCLLAIYIFLLWVPVHALYSFAYYWFFYCIVKNMYYFMWIETKYKYIHFKLGSLSKVYNIYLHFMRVHHLFCQSPSWKAFKLFPFSPSYCRYKKNQHTWLCALIWLPVYNISEIVIGMSVSTCISDFDRYFKLFFQKLTADYIPIAVLEHACFSIP